MLDDEADLHDVALIARIDAIPSILEIACRITGLRFAAVARVTDSKWMACAVRDEIAFGLEVGGELDLKTTICNEIRASGAGVIIDHVAQDPAFRDHHTPRMYGFESYISIPILRGDGSFFGTLCALDPLPAKLSDPAIVASFQNFATLIGLQLDTQEDLMRKEAALFDAGRVAEVREQFIAILGHDLRNPVAAIEAGTILLGRMALGDRAAGIIGQMRQSTKRMGGLIDDLFDFARGRLGSGLILNSKPAERLADTLKAIVSELQLVHPDRRIAVDIRLAEPVCCDTERMAQLLSNLLGNALIHGASDERIAVKAKSAQGVFELSVTNGGPPISAGAMETMFQPFDRAGKDGSRGGLGLGLFIANEIAKAHHGTLTVASDASGTRFTLTMPSVADNPVIIDTAEDRVQAREEKAMAAHGRAA